MKLNKQILSWMGVSALLLTTACSNDTLSQPTPEEVIAGEVYGKGSSIVTLNISANNSVGTRAISDGTKALSLYFEVYDLGVTKEIEEDATFEIGENNPDIKLWASNVPVTATEDAVEPEPAAVEGEEETTDLAKPIKIVDYKATIKLAVDPDHSYRIALWAQKDTEGEYTSPFTFQSNPFVVNVNYSMNNIEEMDAFCAIKEFEGTTGGTVILHRPFAQLNVGTTGADYNNYVSGNIYPNRTITYSQVVVSDVYSAFDVANDKVTGDSDKVTLEFNKTIAEQTKDAEEYLKVKLNHKDITSIEYWDGKAMTQKTVEAANVFFPFKEDYPTMRAYSDLNAETAEWIRISVEEYQSLIEEGWTPVAGIASLKDYPIAEEDLEAGKYLANVNNGITYKYDNVKGGTLYDKDNGIYNPTPAPKNVYFTEEFKYLSMCYVLVKDDRGADWEGLEGTPFDDPTHEVKDEFKSTILDKVDVYFAETGGDSYKNDHKYFSVKNVPVHRNWRTNLLGGLYDPEDPNDPNGPDDPSSLFYNTKIAVYLCPIYYGEFNGSSNNAADNHYDPIWGGWFDTSDNNMHDTYHPEEHSSSAD